MDIIYFSAVIISEWHNNLSCISAIPYSNVISGLLVQIFLFIGLFCAGLYYEWLACIAAIFLLAYLVYLLQCNGVLRVPRAPLLLAALSLPLFMGLSVVWGVDKGLSLLGMAKFLAVPLFTLAVSQLTAEQQEAIWQRLPWIGAAMTGISFLCSRIDTFADFFLAENRLAGFFQYPNTFALFLLICVAILLFWRQLSKREIACLAVLLSGIALSGSRTVFAILIAVLALYCIRHRKDKTVVVVVSFAILLVAVSVGYSALSGDVSSVGRFLTTTLSSSTFLGRLLYFRDALPVVLKHPLGLGYMGYYYTQGSFQTGMYSVVHVHNDLIQLLLDVGWIPAGLWIWAIIHSLRINLTRRRLLIVVIVLHSLFDFDLQYLAILFLLLLAMSGTTDSLWTVRRRPVLIAAAALFTAFSLYIGTASFMNYIKADEAAVSLYPVYTSSQIRLLMKAQEPEKMDQIAQDILSHNESVSLAWSARARAAYARGDFGAMIEYKRKAIRLSKYALEEYLDYFDMLSTGISLYEEAGDKISADYCRQRILEIPGMLKDVEENTSKLGWMIQDQPELMLPEEYQKQLEQLMK